MRRDRLRDYRKKKGLTQIEMSEMLGLGSKEIWRYENTETQPSADTLASIAQLLEVSTDFLMGLSDDPIPDIQEDDLSLRERRVIAALRQGDKMEAIKVIVGDE